MSKEHTPDHIADANKKVQPAPSLTPENPSGGPWPSFVSEIQQFTSQPAPAPFEIFSVVTCGECKRIWVGYPGCLTKPLPCGHMRSQWAVGSAVVDDMLSASSTRQKNMEEEDDDDDE